MKAITDWQPWGTLIIIGAKTNETRGWETKYRGPIAIHAAKTLSASAKIWTRATPEIQAALPCPIEQLPLGAVLGTVELVDCLKVISLSKGMAILSDGSEVTGDELEFGDYTPGRYAWKLRNPVKYDKPIPARGQQGLWNWEDDLK